MTLNCFEVFLVHTCTVGLGQALLVPYPLCMTAVTLHFPHVCPCSPEKHGHINWWLCLILFKTTPFKILLKGLIQQHNCLLMPPCSNQQVIRIAVYVPLADFLWCRLQIYCFYRVQNKITAFSLCGLFMSRLIFSQLSIMNEHILSIVNIVIYHSR